MWLSEKIIKFMESDIAPYAVLTIILLVMVSPLVLITLNSFKSNKETFMWPPTVVPREPVLDSYRKVIWGGKSPIPLGIRNSCIISGVSTFIVLSMSLFTAYGLSRYKFRGSNYVLFFILVTRMIPPLSLIVPFYLVMTWLSLTNTFACIILLSVYMRYPLIVWMLKGFFDDVPQDLIDSAQVDGCGRTGAFLRIVLPFSAVCIAAGGIITFLWTWNDFLYPMMFLSTPDVQPLTLGIFHFVGEEVIEWNSLSAVSIFTSLPAIIFFVIAQRYIIAGLTRGAVKF